MIKQNLLECNQLERSKDDVTARAGLIMFDGFMKAMKIEETIKNPDASGLFQAQTGD